MDAFLGTILAVGFPFPPRGWMTCAGQILPINSNGALFALLGTQYGGDGQTTFALPDLRGRVPVGQSLGQTGPARIVGNAGQVGGTAAVTVVSTGSANVTLTVANLPAHSHNASFTPAGGGATTVTINASKDSATSPDPLPGGYLAAGASDGPNAPFLYSSGATAGTVQLNAGMTTVGGGGSGGGTVSVSNTGTGTPLAAPVTTTANISTTPPFLTIQYIICVSGIYPSRN